MATRMGALPRQRASRPQPTITNNANSPAYEQDKYEQYVQVLLTNIAGNTYYVSAKDNQVAALEAHVQMAETDPVFMAKAAVYARQKGSMRLQPIVALAILSKYRPDLAGKIFKEIIKTPGDLSDLFALFLNTPVDHPCHRESLGNKKTGFARHVVNYFNTLSEYHAIKYKTGGSVFALRDMLRMIRPYPLNKKQGELFEYIVQYDRWKKEHKSASELPQVQRFEQLKQARNEEEAVFAIDAGRLPHEVVTGSVSKMTPVLWKTLIPNMPYFALLRNLVTLYRAGVLEEAQGEIAKKLTNKKTIEQAGILPFQILNATRTVMNAMPNSTYRVLINALHDALEHSVINMPALPGKVCISLDQSGSMDGRLTESLSYIDVAALFAAAYLKANPDAVVLPFDTTARPANLNPRDSLVTLYTQLLRVGGGTTLSAPVNYMLNHDIKVDYYLSFTDTEHWHGQDFYSTWLQYRGRNPKTKAFLVRMDSYQNSPVPFEDKKVYTIYGWGDTVLKGIQSIAENGPGQVNHIQNLTI